MTAGARRLLAIAALAAGVTVGMPSALQAQAATTALDRRVSLRFNDVSLRDALDRVMAVAHVRISYSAELLPLDRGVRVGFDSASVRDVLHGLLHGLPVAPMLAGGDQIVLAPVATAAAAPVESPSLGVADLDRVVITGTAMGASQRALPIALSVVDGNEVRRRGARDLASVVDGAVPGLWAFEQSPASLVARYGSVRGASSFGATYPKMYVDGIAVANPLLVTQLDPESIERIEVIRGPQGAALYGADAISGVLNIITRHDGASAGTSVARLHAAAGYASSDYTSAPVLAQDYRASAGFGSGLRTANLDLGVGSLGAFYSGASSRSIQASAGGRAVSERSVLTGTARIVDGSVGTTVNPLLAEALSTALGRAVTGIQAESQGLQQYTVGASWRFMQNERWAHSIVAGADGYSLSNVANDFTPFPSSADSALRAATGAADRTTLRLSSVARFGEPERTAATLTFAAEHSLLHQVAPAVAWNRDANGLLEAMRVGNGKDKEIGMGPPSMPMPSSYALPLPSAFAQQGLLSRPTTKVDWFNDLGFTTQLDLAFRNSFFVTGGARLERNSGYATSAEAHLLPMLGASWVREVGNAVVKFRGAYGRGIRAPRTAARETIGGGYHAQSVVSELEPESQQGTEVGMDLLVGRGLSLQVTRFDQLASGLIQQVVIPGTTTSNMSGRGGGLALQYQNVGAIGNHGWEGQVTAHLGRLALSASGTLVDSKVRSIAAAYSGDLRLGDRPLGVPRRMLGASASWTATHWGMSLGLSRAFDWIEYDRLSLAAAYVSFARGDVPLYGADLRGYWRRYDGNTRLRLSATRDLSRGITFVISGENLLNLQRGEPDNATIVPGRLITTGFRFSRF